MTSTILIHHASAAITVSIADTALAGDMAAAITRALSSVPSPPRLPRVVHVRTQKKLATLAANAPNALTDAVVNVRVTDRNARRLPDLVDAIRAMKPAGVQLVWDGIDPARERAEQHVFVVLERARSTPAGPPVVLVKTVDDDKQPSLALRFLVDSRNAHQRRNIPC